MNSWLWAATVLLAAVIPCLVLAALGTRLDAFVALQASGSLVALILLLLAQGFARSSYSSLALIFALASLIGGLVFARFLERWL